jgi:hypothetical protein
MLRRAVNTNLDVLEDPKIAEDIKQLRIRQKGYYKSDMEDVEMTLADEDSPYPEHENGHDEARYHPW